MYMRDASMLQVAQVKRAGDLPSRFSSTYVRQLLWSEIHDMDVGSEAHVVGQVPAIVVRILVDNDVVAGPIPITAESKVDRGNAPVPSAKPEPAWAATR